MLLPSVVKAAVATLAADALTMADAVAAEGGGGVIAGGEVNATGSRGGRWGNSRRRRWGG